MAFAPESTYFDRGGDGSILGCFTERDAGNLFEFSRNDDDMEGPWNYGLEDFPHKVWVTSPWPGIDHGYRYAKVLKTVAYIGVDEDAEGNPIVEKWFIKDQREYPQPEAA